MKSKKTTKGDAIQVNLTRKCVCAGCGKHFYPKNTTINYCSDKCRRRSAKNRHHRDEYTELHYLGLQI